MDKFTHEDWKAFEGGELVVNCVTEEDANHFLDTLMECGYRWCASGDELSNTNHFEYYKQYTCYRCNTGKEISYANTSHYENRNLTIKQWQEEPKQDETVPTWEMVRLLMENPKREATFCDGGVTHKISYKNNLFSGLGRYFDFKLHRTTDRWTIIEPPKELKKMDIKEIWKLVRDNKADKHQIVSLETNRSMSNRAFRNLTDEEIDGLWTCEGIFEEDETNG